MNLIGYDPFVSPEYAQNIGVRLVSLDQIYSESDFITLHLPLTPNTRGLIGAKELSKMKPTARIVNCARGGLVDEEALFNAVEQGKIAGAAVDVFSSEPAVNNVLCKSSKIIVTPHLGASTAEAQVGVAVDVAEQIVSVLHGQPARYAVNMPHIPAELMSTLGPWMVVASTLGSLAGQLMEGQVHTLQVKYCGELSGLDTSPIKAAVISGLLGRASEERITMVNAAIIAGRRGVKIVEQKETVCENYGSLITLDLITNTGTTTVAGTVMRGTTHVVQVNSFWVDIVPTGGWFLFGDHRDRPGVIGAVGSITGKADVNISSMQLGRLQPRGQALIVLALDEPLPEPARQQILALPEFYSVKIVKL